MTNQAWKIIRNISIIQRRSRRQAPYLRSSVFIMLKMGIALVLLPGAVSATSISFTNIAEDPAMDLDFERTRSRSYSLLRELYDESLENPFTLDEVFARTPHRPGGFPGVALLDYDGDGDLDIYVTNGPGSANGLFSNQLTETGRLGFVDLSASSGADATDLDSNGVCFGDLDNDGDEDLYVLGREAENRLYENIGGGFVEVLKHGAEGGTGAADAIQYQAHGARVGFHLQRQLIKPARSPQSPRRGIAHK